MAWFNANGWEGRNHAPSEQAFIGNGVIGWRLSANPIDYSARCYVTGFTGKKPPHGVNSLIDLPSPLSISVEFGRNETQVEVERQNLDYKEAALHTRMHVRDKNGNLAQVDIRNVAYRNVPSLLGVQMTITPQQTGPISLRLTPPKPTSHCHIEKICASAPGAFRTLVDMRILWRSNDTSTRCGAVILPMVDPSQPQPIFMVTASGFEMSSDTILVRWDNLIAHQPVTTDWFVALVSDLYHPHPLQQAGRMVSWGALAIGSDELFAAHCKLWEDLWVSRPVVDSNDDTQRAIDGSMFCLHASVHRSSRQSMAPFGLSGNGYYGHVFWDCETWTYPSILLQNPDAARSILEFRLKGLEQARNTAALFGFDGAMFPWESDIHGAEDTPVWAGTGYMEHHITPDIAYAFWQYQCVTGDQEFLHQGTWPVLKNIAQWIASRVEKTSRGYEIRHIIPADEHCYNVNNSAHTNLACAMALRAACACAQLVGYDSPQLWSDIAGNIVVPRGENNLILQQDGWTSSHNSKQADTALAIYPLGIVDNPEDISGIIENHMKIDPHATCKVAMGDQLNAVICARAGKTDLARTVWERGWKPFWIEPWGMFAEKARKSEGCFITGCGGLLQAVLIGFPGLQLDRKGYAFHQVAMPNGWKSITCEQLFFNGKAHRLIAEPGKHAQLIS